MAGREEKAKEGTQGREEGKRSRGGEPGQVLAKSPITDHISSAFQDHPSMVASSTCLSRPSPSSFLPGSSTIAPGRPA